MRGSSRRLLPFLLLVCSHQAVAAFEGFTSSAGEFLVYGPRLDRRGEGGEVRLSRVERYGLAELAVSSVSVLFNACRAGWDVNWQSSGDELYRENRLSAAVEMTVAGARWRLDSELYHLFIKGYGSGMAPGIGAAAILTPHPGIRCSAGVDGLWCGRLRDGWRDVPRVGWSRLSWRATENVVLTGMLSLPERRPVGTALGVEAGLGDMLTGRVQLSDSPAGWGAGFDLHLSSWTLTLAASNEPPLGWSQRFAMRWKW